MILVRVVWVEAGFEETREKAVERKSRHQEWAAHKSLEVNGRRETGAVVGKGGCTTVSFKIFCPLFRVPQCAVVLALSFRVLLFFSFMCAAS